MIEKKRSDIRWLEFEIFQEFSALSHGVIVQNEQLKSGGDLNVQIDEKKSLSYLNYQSLTQLLNLPPGAFLSQIHRDHILPYSDSISKKDLKADGWISSMKKKTLWIKHADCQAVIFYDPKKNVLANVHCGWRGSVLNILGKTVDLFIAQYDCNPKNIRVGISPSLGPLFAEFIYYKTEFPKTFWKFQNKPNYFNFWNISLDQLLSKGLLEKNIEIARLCTFERQDLFFSYRRNKTLYRNATFACLL